MPVNDADAVIKQEIVAYLERLPFESSHRATGVPSGTIESDLASPRPMFPRSAIEAFEEARAAAA